MKSRKFLNAFIRQQRSDECVAHLPLRGIRVIDAASVVAAPYAATLLADFGAEVIKVENPKIPDAPRSFLVHSSGVSPFWSWVGRNKFPVSLDFKSKSGKRIFWELVTRSDVLIENMRSGTLERLGFGPERLLQRNPGLIIGRLSAYGQSGPYAKRPGFGTLAEGYCGYTFLNATSKDMPMNAPMALADCTAAVHLALAIVICLRNQKRGEMGGQIIDISLYEPLFSFFGGEFANYSLTDVVPNPLGNEISYVAPRNNFRTKDGKWVTLSASVQRAFERLMKAIGRAELIDDPRFKNNDERIKPKNRRAINQAIAEWTENRTLNEVIEKCEELDVAIGPIFSMDEIMKDPHYKARESWIEIRDPVTDKPLRLPAVPFRLLRSPGQIRFPGLPHGSANEIIYQDLLGYSPTEIRKLKKEGII